MLLPTDLPWITFTNTQGTSSFPSPSPSSLLLDPSPRPDSYSCLWLTSTKGPDRDISLIKVMRLKIHNPHYTTLEMRRQAGKRSSQVEGTRGDLAPFPSITPTHFKSRNGAAL